MTHFSVNDNNWLCPRCFLQDKDDDDKSINVKFGLEDMVNSPDALIWEMKMPFSNQSFIFSHNFSFPKCTHKSRREI
jgi:hypothetical protein